mmetsp:Transcript_30692/g.57461  ORF Transcript_30692/g.57461 Transcript_30692/m.57461 type:complete len:493 (-) Transcript_30692:105-1583(-)
MEKGSPAVEIAFTTITGQLHQVHVPANMTVWDCKVQMETLTQIPAVEQKLLDGTVILQDDMQPFGEIVQRGAELMILRQPGMDLPTFVKKHGLSESELAANLDELLAAAADHDEPSVCLEIVCHSNFGEFEDDESRTDKRRASVLQRLTQPGFLPAFECLVQHEAFGRIPGMLDEAFLSLHVAASRGLPAHCRCLLESPDFHGAAFRKDTNSTTALHHAANAQTLQALLECPALATAECLNAQDRHGCTALHYATTEEMCRMILTHPEFTSVNMQDLSGQTALHCARNPGICTALLEHGAAGSLDKADRMGRTALHALSRNEATLPSLLHLSTHELFDINALDKRGRSALHFAGSDVVCSLLFAAGLEAVNAIDSYGMTCLHTAKTVAVARAILQHPRFCELNAMTLLEATGRADTALMQAVSTGDEDMVLELIKHPGHDLQSLEKAIDSASSGGRLQRSVLDALLAARDLSLTGTEHSQLKVPVARSCALL